MTLARVDLVRVDVAGAGRPARVETDMHLRIAGLGAQRRRVIPSL